MVMATRTFRLLLALISYETDIRVFEMCLQVSPLPIKFLSTVAYNHIRYINHNLNSEHCSITTVKKAIFFSIMSNN